ncbi:beta/alpha barrel domain-containing protein [Massilia orientalis]|uniref:Uncharacterized protein n=1 Tax=Massilia orientalis TaxID=3050128 RepID=A0ACC7MFC0_9BURK|nr:hypothetical protein [Massilia sp. YIM B02787]
MNVLPALQERVVDELRDYAAKRKNDVRRGAETPELAALLVEKYGEGLVKALHIAEDLLDVSASRLRAEVDRLVLEIDPDAEENRKRRWASRPAGVSIGRP